MKTRFALPTTILGGVVFALLQAAPAQAQATRTWVSGVGDDVNPCSRTAPCKTFAGAISKTAAGGMINCLDPGGYGAVTITKSITIKCFGTFGSILASAVNGVVINDSATGTPGTIKVVLSHIDIDGAGTTLGLNGIRFVSGASLVVHAVQIRNFSANGIDIAPMNNGTNPKEVFIADSYISNVGSNNQNAAIRVSATAPAGAQMNVSVNNTKAENSTNGIFVDGGGGGGTSNVAVTNSQFSGMSANGVSVFGTGNTMRANVTNSMMSGNASAGVGASGAGASAKIGGNTITFNVTGVTGTVTSFKQNMIADNGTDGTPVTAVPGGPLN
jgi:hypothetical protein